MGKTKWSAEEWAQYNAYYGQQSSSSSHWEEQPNAWKNKGPKPPKGTADGKGGGKNNGPQLPKYRQSLEDVKERVEEQVDGQLAVVRVCSEGCQWRQTNFWQDQKDGGRDKKFSASVGRSTKIS